MTVIEYTLTKPETDIAASRFAWRAALADGLLAGHVAPLTAFVLTIAFAAVLGLTGLIGRRSAEIALLLAAAGYTAYRLWTRRRFLQLRREAIAWGDTLRAGPLRLSLDANGLSLDGAGFSRRWAFTAPLEIEEVSGLVYVWPARAAPLVWPTRADADGAFLRRARASAGRLAA